MWAVRTVAEIAAALGAVVSAIVAFVALNRGQQVAALIAAAVAIGLFLSVAWWIARRKIGRRIDRTFILGPENRHVIHLDMHKRIVLNGSMNADNPVTYWLMDADDLDRFEKCKVVEVIDMGENVLEGTFDAGPGLDGSYVLVVENDDEDDNVEVRVTIQMQRR